MIFGVICRLANLIRSLSTTTFLLVWPTSYKVNTLLNVISQLVILPTGPNNEMGSILPLPLLLLSLLISFKLVHAQFPPQPENIGINGTSFLDHEAPISHFWGRTFLKENIPFIDIPDETIQNVYYYRWSSIQRHLRYTVAGTGYILTEFVQPVSYAQAFGTIDAAAGHQIDEARWLRSKFYDDDYIQAYTRGPGNTTQYTHW